MLIAERCCLAPQQSAPANRATPNTLRCSRADAFGGDKFDEVEHRAMLMSRYCSTWSSSPASLVPSKPLFLSAKCLLLALQPNPHITYTNVPCGHNSLGGGGKEHSPDGEIWPGHELHVSMSLHVLTGQELLPYMACTSVLIPCMQHVPSQHLWAQVASLCCLQVFPSHYSQVTLESSFLSASILHNSASKSAHDPHRCDPCPQGGIWLVA